MDEERVMVSDLLTLLAILKCTWSVASIACTRKCNWPVAWLLFVELLQCSAFALQLINWPGLVNHLHPSHDMSGFEIDCVAIAFVTAMISLVSLIQCIDEVLMLRRDGGKWILKAFLQGSPLLVVLAGWCAWAILAHRSRSLEEAFERGLARGKKT